MIELVYSADGEEFDDDISTVIDDITGWQCMTIEEAREATIYVGEPDYPKVNVNWLTESVTEHVGDVLYEHCGEYSDYWVPKDVEELKQFLDSWLNKQNYNCYSVKNVVELPITNFIDEKELKEIYEN
jgi:hypothetical protein